MGTGKGPMADACLTCSTLILHMAHFWAFCTLAAPFKKSLLTVPSRQYRFAMAVFHRLQEAAAA